MRVSPSLPMKTKRGFFLWFWQKEQKLEERFVLRPFTKSAYWRAMREFDGETLAFASGRETELVCRVTE